ncbi:MAG: LLM class flavin-dependent oxidoreductase [Rhodospirillales bacterium]|nr:LLM class flavin-dependent oxidoreductase [Rhodospirillales bacterium]
MKLGMFYWPCGHHIAAWRHPDGVADSGGNLPHLIELAQMAERGLFDMFFMADSVSFWRGSLDALSRDAHCAWIEPFTVMGALAQHTTNLGLVCTATSTYEQPFFLARRFASLDIISRGRAGWNLVTTGNESAAQSFGYDEHIEKSVRYRSAREFAHVVRGLWNSWGDDAFVHDKEAGIFFDKDKLQVLEHKGEFYRVRGPLHVPASPQGEPVLVQAGASEDGRALAAETAEVVFGASQTLALAQEFYADVKTRMAAFGRHPDSLKIMPGLSVSVAETHEEAAAKWNVLQDLIDPKTGMELLSERLHYDISGFDVDDYLPAIPIDELGGSRAELIVEMARREKMTIRDLYRHFAGTRGHRHITGSATEVADFMEEWVTERGCDGFNIMPPLFPSGLEDFIELVIPELQRRGLYRTEYTGSTLRENLELPRPPWSARDLKQSA